MERAFVGIDVAMAKKKPLPISVCICERGKLTPLSLQGLKLPHPRGFGNKRGLDSDATKKYALDTLHYLVEIQNKYDLSIACIAIDAPSNYRLETIPRRMAEQAMDKKKISCFATPSNFEFQEIIGKATQHLQNGGAENRIPHANQIRMLSGFALFEELKKHYKCIEVFPQAIAHSLGVSLIHKTKQDGYQKQLVALAAHSGWESSEQLSQALQRTGVGASHDRLDAFMSAWVSYLFCIGKAKALGLLPDDAIWIPDVEKGLPAEKFQVANHSVRNKKTKSSPIGKFSRNSECLCCRKGMDSELP